MLAALAEIPESYGLNKVCGLEVGTATQQQARK
jgi:hypothetical protein